MKADQYARELLVQAEALVESDPTKPVQAKLRRAVSTAYYSLLHAMVDESTKQVLGRKATGRRATMRRALGRGYDHRTMADACKSFSGGTLPDALRAAAPPGTIPASVRSVARIFLELQRARHRADYNLQRDFSRSEAKQFIQDVRDATKALGALSADDVGCFFLAVLPTFTEIARHKD